MSNRAWVTLATNDSYGLGALVLAHSLRRASSIYPAAVLITPSVTEAMRERLRAVFAEVVVVDVLDSRDAAHLALLQRPELGITFTKIHCWGLTQYEKCVFLDADTLIVQNCDELFEREELSAAPDVGWPDCFNSGVFVYKPSQETLEQLIKFAQERGSFDGGDQGLLNSFFSDWARGDINKHLPFLYNVTSAAFYSYIPALKHYGQNLKIIHFIGATKPWLQQFNWESRSVDAPEHLREFLQLWWDLFVGQVHSQLDVTMVEVPDAPPELPPPDVIQHYTPVVDPESEFPWHHPDAQIQEDHQKLEVDLTEFHDPWAIYGGQIPSYKEEVSLNTLSGRVEDHEEMKKYAWDYQPPSQDYGSKAFTDISESHHDHQQWQTYQNFDHSHREIQSHHLAEKSHWEAQSQHSHNQVHDYTSYNYHQHPHDHQQHSHEHHQHAYHHHHHSYDHHQHSIDDHQHHQHSHEQIHHTHEPNTQSQNIQEHYHHGQPEEHQHHEEISSQYHHDKKHEYSDQWPHTHDHQPMHSHHMHDHSKKQHSHESNDKQHGLVSSDSISHDTNNVQRIYHSHLHHYKVPDHVKHKDDENKIPSNQIEVMNGNVSENDDDYHEDVRPRHPYDDFYLKHRSIIDSYGRKICSHEIPLTPKPSEPIYNDYQDDTDTPISLPEESPLTNGHCEEQSGVAGNLARVVPGAASFQREALDELTRRQGWEAGNIDYMGADSFDNIWAKISQTLSKPRVSPPKQPSPPKEPSPPKQPSPPKEPSPPKQPSPPKEIPVEVAQEATAIDAASTPASEPVVEAVSETPVAAEVKPVVEAAVVPVEAAPAEAPQAPVIAAPAPVETVPTPVEAAPAPVESAPTPVESAPTLAEPASTPVESAPAPVEATPTPVKAAPVAEVPKSVDAAPTEVVAAPAPVEVETKPAEKAPVASETKPVPTPVEAAPAPQVEARVAAEAPVAAAVPVASEPEIATTVAAASKVKSAEIPAKVEESAATPPEAKEKSATVEASAAGEQPKKKTSKTEPALPPTPPESPKSEEKAAPVKAAKEASPVAPLPVTTPEKSSEATVCSDSPPLANTPSKDEAPTLPAAKSEERRKGGCKLQLKPPAAADPLPTPDSEVEDAASLATSIIASELRTPTVTSPASEPEPTSPPAPLQSQRLSVDEPEVPTPPVGAVSLAQIGVKTPKPKSSTAAQIESSVTEKGPNEPATPTEAAPKKKIVIRKVVKKDKEGASSAEAPVPPPRKKEKKPKEK